VLILTENKKEVERTYKKAGGSESQNMVEEFELARDRIAKKIAGEVCLADRPGAVIKKWRHIMKIAQRELAEEVGVMPSVISDYESGRRKSPGIRVVKKIVDGLLSIDEKHGGKLIKEFSNFPETAAISNAILDIREFTEAVSIKKVAKAVDGEIILNFGEKDIYGYTIIDSLKAIVEFSPMELVKLYGLTTERALIFTGVSTGRSPMVAIKVTNLRPGLVVMHGTNRVDEIAKRIANAEQIPLILSKAKSVKELMNSLRKKFT